MRNKRTQSAAANSDTIRFDIDRFRTKSKDVNQSISPSVTKFLEDVEKTVKEFFEKENKENEK